MNASLRTGLLITGIAASFAAGWFARTGPIREQFAVALHARFVDTVVTEAILISAIKDKLVNNDPEGAKRTALISLENTGKLVREHWENPYLSALTRDAAGELGFVGADQSNTASGK